MKTKVLLIEDEDLLTLMYAQKLNSDGYECNIAEDGVVGMKMAKKILPDIILCDIMMPKKDGIRTLQELKKDKRTKDIPVIMLTNLHEKDYTKKALELGAESYLIKTETTPTDVVKKVKKFLNSNKA
jgi:diguanylate cyclase